MRILATVRVVLSVAVSTTMATPWGHTLRSYNFLKIPSSFAEAPLDRIVDAVFRHIQAFGILNSCS